MSTVSNQPTIRKIPLLDLKALHKPLREEILAEIARVADAQSFIMGEDVKLLEKDIAAYCRVPYAYGCASGSDALFLALLALGIRHGDRVLTTPFTFFSTAGSIVRAGAMPVFADIDPDTYNLSPDSVLEAVRHNPGIKAIMPVHLFGGAADMDPLLQLARERGLAVIEDGAQAIGAEYKGQRLMSLGDVGCISFFPSKNLGGFGDGGMVTARAEGIARRLAALRVHGSAKKYYHEWVGINSRLDTLQAAVLRVKLKHLDAESEGRQRNADRYRELLKGLPATPSPIPDYQNRHVYNQFVIRCPRRDELKAYLAESGVNTEIYYPLSMHQQACFAELGYREGDFPQSERAAREVLAIPVHSALPAADLEYVADRIRRFYV
jgi:dTDP-4-amino-4,6-dideoxygalactose transaminase